MFGTPAGASFLGVGICTKGGRVASGRVIVIDGGFFLGGGGGAPFLVLGAATVFSGFASDLVFALRLTSDFGFASVFGLACFGFAARFGFVPAASLGLRLTTCFKNPTTPFLGAGFSFFLSAIGCTFAISGMDLAQRHWTASRTTDWSYYYNCPENKYC